jgi:hypothetical protein
MTAAEPHWGYPSAIVVRKPFDTRHLLGLVQTVSEQAKTTAPQADLPHSELRHGDRRPGPGKTQNRP